MNLTTKQALDEIGKTVSDIDKDIGWILQVGEVVFTDKNAPAEDILDVVLALRRVARLALGALQDVETRKQGFLVPDGAPLGVESNGLSHWELPVTLTYPIESCDVAIRHPGDTENDFRDRGFERMRSALNALSRGAGISYIADLKGCRRVAE